MEALKKPEELVLELLGLHHCVTIPGLGSFIYREAPASANTFTFELKPAARTVFFNNAIIADDGVLVNLIRQYTGLNYNAALGLANDMASDIRKNIDTKRTISFGKLGNFFLNAENQVFFVPSASLNLSTSTYGLPVIKLDEMDSRRSSNSVKSVVEHSHVTELKNTPQPEFEEAEVLQVEENDQKRNLGWLWKAAAVAAIAILGASGIYYGSKLFGTKTSGADKAQISPSVNSSEDVKGNQTPATENTVANAEYESETPTTEFQEVEVFSPIQNAEYLQNLQVKKGDFYVLGGMYMDNILADLEVASWNKVGVNATVFKAENSSLYKVIINRFTSEKEASDFISNAPVYSGAHLSVRETKLIK